MEIHNIPTDDTMRSLLTHGSADFPFEYYMDEISRFNGQCIAWHWHREVEFSLVLKGTVRCSDEQSVYLLSEGEGLFINAGTLHRFESDDGGVMVNMVFAPELIAQQGTLLFAEYVKKILTSGHSLLVFTKSSPREQQFLDHITRLYKSTSKNLFSVHNAVCILWEALLDYIGDVLPNAQNNINRLLRARMRKMVQFIHENYSKRIRLNDIAAAANISVSEALRCFHDSAQTTPIRYLNDYRLLRAKALLMSTDDSVTNIAAAAGFENPSYFCRVFKNRLGISPNKCRSSALFDASRHDLFPNN